MEYTGEHLAPGLLGNAFIAIAFSSALLSVFAYFFSTRTQESSQSWKKIGRYAFITHAVSVFIFTGILFYLLVNHYYEYDYVYEQSKNDMSMRYILVCFWGGQRGSFMLWLFWQAVLGLILLRSSKKWEVEVMTFYSGIQVFLTSMLLGIYIWDESMVGVNPFALKRDVIQDWGALWSAIPEYLQLDPSFADGKGLNPLLQNYWMVIHPPTLFLGFSLVAVPFVYALAGLWKKDFSGWLKPAIPWTFFGIAILGIGILMGGAWAYESLSFGGFWAWDPVENASFVPWIILVGAGHLMLLNKNKPSSLFSTFLLTIFSFFFILYSTFLTRSGVLGEESVHSFTGDGLMGQLLLFMFFFLYLGFVMMIQDKKMQLYFSGFIFLIFIIHIFGDPGYTLLQSGGAKVTLKSVLLIVSFIVSFIFLYAGYQLKFANNEKEEDLWSREFWMFIGSNVLLLAALQIIFTTSIPVINLLFDTNITKISLKERNEFYNNWQLPFAFIVCVLAGFSQYLKYKSNDIKKLAKQLLYPAIVALLLTFLFIWIYQFSSNATDFKLSLLMFAAFFSVAANTDYWLRFLKGKINHAGASIAHIGFGIIMLGTIWSMGRQQNLSENRQGYWLEGMSDDFSNRLDVQVFKDDTVRMKNYFITYSGRYQNNHFTHYKTTYFTAINKEFKKGDKVRYGQELFICNTDHIASLFFFKDKSYWKLVENFSSEELMKTKAWDYLQCGDKLFDVEPFLQVHLNKDGGKPMVVSEPGTVHYPSYDIFTHLKDAEFMMPPNAKYRAEIVRDTLLGDTMRTAGLVFSSSNIMPVLDSVKYPNKVALSIDFNFYDIRDFYLQHPIKKKLYFSFSENEKELSPVEYVAIPELRIKAGLKQVLIEEDHSGHDHTSPSTPGDSLVHQNHPAKEVIRYQLSILTDDYIVLQVRKFPLINLLWIGCILMFIGTLMAVIYRVKTSRKLKSEN